jgi:hypothetical protein
MPTSLDWKTKILIPANDNIGGRYIVALHSEDSVFSVPLRQVLNEAEQCRYLSSGHDQTH